MKAYAQNLLQMPIQKSPKREFLDIATENTNVLKLEKTNTWMKCRKQEVDGEQGGGDREDNERG